MEKHIINYKGQTFETKFSTEITDEEFNFLKQEYYKKPDKEEVLQQLYSVLNKGGKKLDLITGYYFKHIMSKVRLYFSKWSIEDVFNCKELVAFFKHKSQTNDKVFPKDKPLITNIETAIRLGGKGCASKPTNFPISAVDDILQEFNINNNYYDFSCGWGVRLLGSVRNGLNYFGTDPNYELTEQLNNMAQDLALVGNTKNIDIRTQGSEVFVPEWENKMGVAFSSPPYFNLEDYKIGNQSWKQGTNYEDWKEKYLKPTLENIKKYLVNGGACLVNINNFNGLNLVEDTIEIGKSLGFRFAGFRALKNIQRCKSSGGFNDNSEKIIVFIKEN